MIDVITTSYKNINDNLFTGLEFIDLKKAFDMVSHENFLLKSYIITGFVELHITK